MTTTDAGRPAANLIVTRIEFRPRGDLVRRISTAVAAEIAAWPDPSWGSGVLPARRYSLWPVGDGRGEWLSGTVADRYGRAWAPVLARRPFFAPDDPGGGVYRVSDALSGWALAAAGDVWAAWAAGRSPPPALEVVPPETTIPMRGIRFYCGDGGVWTIPDVTYDVDPASDLSVVFRAPPGFVGLRVPAVRPGEGGT